MSHLCIFKTLSLILTWCLWVWRVSFSFMVSLPSLRLLFKKLFSKVNNVPVKRSQQRKTIKRNISHLCRLWTVWRGRICPPEKKLNNKSSEEKRKWLSIIWATGSTWVFLLWGVIRNSQHLKWRPWWKECVDGIYSWKTWGQTVDSTCSVLKYNSPATERISSPLW